MEKTDIQARVALKLQMSVCSTIPRLAASLNETEDNVVRALRALRRNHNSRIFVDNDNVYYGV
jgi:hypothetical protein